METPSPLYFSRLFSWNICTFVEAPNNISGTVVLDGVRVYNQYMDMSAADLHLHLNREAKNKEEWEEWEEWLDLRTLSDWSGTLWGDSPLMFRNILLEMNLLKHSDISFNVNFCLHNLAQKSRFGRQEGGVTIYHDAGGSWWGLQTSRITY